MVCFSDSGIVNERCPDGLALPSNTSANAAPPISPGRDEYKIASTWDANGMRTGPPATTYTTTLSNFSKGKSAAPSKSKFSRSVPSEFLDAGTKHTTVTASGSCGPFSPSSSPKALRLTPAAVTASSGYGHAVFPSGLHRSSELGMFGSVPAADPDSALKWTSSPHPYISTLAEAARGRSPPEFCSNTIAFVATSCATNLDSLVRTSF
mmetsp:Transcript_78149/g.203645  ORF Transcript_78149/g.203645 Transcript_78149/m.203645 type:complete len:208 (+) Transcript_78149:936-1559(+)